MSDLWPKKWPRSFKKLEQRSLTREFLKQYLTEKQNGYSQSGRLREVVARRELTVSKFIQERRFCARCDWSLPITY